MDEKEGNSVFELIDGLKPVDPKKLEDFQKAMTEEVIPEIVEIIEERKLKAAESRNWQLKY